MKKIIAAFIGDYTGFKQEFDCTQKLQTLSLDSLRSLQDNDVSSDELAPESLIEEARTCFIEEYGKGTRKMEFGYEVVVERILEHFDVISINEIQKCKICGQFESKNKVREHLEGHNPNARGMDSEDVDSQFEG